MRFTQIRHANDKTELKWQGHHNSDSLQTTLASEDTPHAGFIEALEALRPQIPRLIGAPKEYADGVEVRSLNISYQKGDRRGFVISAVKPVELANGPFNISTPLLLEPDLDSDAGGQASQDMMELFEELVEQARLFVSGRREQGELFGDEDEDRAELREQRAVQSAAEQAREIDRVIGYLVGERPDDFASWTDKEILSDLLDCFGERLEGKGFAQFSQLNEAGTSRARCAIANEGGVPRLWYGVEGKIDPEQTPATLMGDTLVEAVRRVWSAQPEQLSLAGPDPVQEWARSTRPAPAPSDEVTTEVVAQCLHTILFAEPGQAAAWHAAHLEGRSDGEIFAALTESFALHGDGKEKYGFSEPIGVATSENVQYVTVDVWVKNLRLKVSISNSKKQSLTVPALTQVVRGMLDIGERQDDDVVDQDDGVPTEELEEEAVPV